GCRRTYVCQLRVQTNMTVAASSRVKGLTTGISREITRGWCRTAAIRIRSGWTVGVNSTESQGAAVRSLWKRSLRQRLSHRRWLNRQTVTTHAVFGLYSVLSRLVAK